jgi:hypothetical protein
MLTGQTHIGCGGKIDRIEKIAFGQAVEMCICLKCKKSVPRSERKAEPVAPYLVNRSGLNR